MTKQHRLFPRGGVFTFRVRVPTHLREIVGKAEIWKSLGRVSYSDASRQARIESVRADALFEEAERILAKGHATSLGTLGDAQLEQIARAYFYGLETSVERMPFSEAGRNERLAAAEDQAAAIGQSIDDAGLHAIAQEVGVEARLEIRPGDAGFGRLLEAVQRALIEHQSREADRAQLKPAATYDPLFAGVSKAGPPQPMPLTIERAVQLFKSAPDHAGMRLKTRASYTCQRRSKNQPDGGAKVDQFSGSYLRVRSE